MSIDILAAVISVSILATVYLGCACADIFHLRRHRPQSLVKNPKSVAGASIHLSRRA
jgi:hypothetical protein